MLRDILIRLFIIIPVSLILILLGLTFIIPLLFWLITGEDPLNFAVDLVENLSSKLL